MKVNALCFISAAGVLVVSCASPTTPVGNVEALERQAPVTADPNAIGDAINAANAVNYSNGRGTRGRGFFGF
jgi:hypothetical protein